MRNLRVVRKILSNEKYKGDTLFQIALIADPLSHRRIKNDEILPQYYAENSISANVEQDVWEHGLADSYAKAAVI